MKHDSRLSSVLHALLHMTAFNRPMTSEALAQCMSTHPVVVRRTMAGLREAGIVQSEKGHGGGWVISADLEKVTLRDIFEALGEPAIFAMGHRNENPQCLVEQAVNVTLASAFDEAEALLMERFASVSIAQIAQEFKARYPAERMELQAHGS